jgi:hypothetical protein
LVSHQALPRREGDREEVTDDEGRGGEAEEGGRLFSKQVDVTRGGRRRRKTKKVKPGASSHGATSTQKPIWMRKPEGGD